MKRAILVAAALAIGCTPTPAAPTLTPEVKAKAAETSYETQLLLCVDKYPGGDPRVDTCADAVRAKWHRGPKGSAK